MKVLRIFLISFMIIIMISPVVLADDDITSTAEDWMSTGKSHAKIGINTEDLRLGSEKLFNLFLAVGTVVAVIVGAFLGVKFMTAGIDERVDVKKALLPYVISCIVMFGSLGIWKLVVLISSQII